MTARDRGHLALAGRRVPARLLLEARADTDDHSDRLRAAAEIITPDPGCTAGEQMFRENLAKLFTAAADNIDALPATMRAHLPATQRLIADIADGYLLSRQPG